MKTIPKHYQIDIESITANHLEALCERYGLSDEQLISHALRLAEKDLVEFEARLAAAQMRYCDEAE
ncbi:hypothetical protein Ga0123462_1730 [Mariprofundus ferrinatatus]|uniref:Uncharacterized protein n=1 Tax=Mariprofundus ferrinatatus TaxID=1921087 RepID=A0A2K8L5I5_9PROT|nr:hypothetical protein [Mariprofundus ferrinatatus]ATX82578.1 hypothetical protein Ga0123462_1730 [Mariprofundus ferrinatatus]